MKKILFFALVFIPVLAIAQDADTATTTTENANAGIFGFFSYAGSFFEDVYTAVAIDAPNAIHRFVAFSIEWFAVAWIYAKIESIQFAWQVAKVILEDLAFGSTLNSLISGLPGDMKAFISLIRIPECIELLASAHITRFVMSLL